MPSAAQTLPWPEAAAFYERLAADRGYAFEPMRAIVQFIASSRYADGMFAAISDETLCVGRIPDFIPGKDELRINFDEAAQSFTFVHARRPDEKYPWSLSCPAAEWESAFEHIVHKRLRWFHQG